MWAQAEPDWTFPDWTSPTTDGPESTLRGKHTPQQHDYDIIKQVFTGSVWFILKFFHLFIFVMTSSGILVFIITSLITRTRDSGSMIYLNELKFDQSDQSTFYFLLM